MFKVWILFFHAAYGLGQTCSFGTALKFQGKVYEGCQITGSSVSEINGSPRKTYFANCSDMQIEFIEGTETVQIVDGVTRDRVADCQPLKEEVSRMIKDHEAKKSAIENPKCILSHWNGQMVFQANGVTGRCSFNMNKSMAELFKKNTGVNPAYQCEYDYFLTSGDSTGTPVYKKTKSGWELACEAATMTGSPIESIDWKNPPKYYQPEGPTVTPAQNPQ